VSDLDKLAPSLSHALEVWRTRSEGSSGLADSRIAVSVAYTGDVEALRRAGLSTGHDVHGEVSGQIAFRDIERLAAVPGVVRVIMQPATRLLLDGTIPEMRVPWKTPPGFTGKGSGVIVAVIDTGIAWVNRPKDPLQSLQSTHPCSLGAHRSRPRRRQLDRFLLTRFADSSRFWTVTFEKRLKVLSDVAPGLSASGNRAPERQSRQSRSRGEGPIVP
jgi:hypothetical protein